MNADNSLDVLIIGAGFSGLHLLQKLRKLNFNVKIYEAGTGIGGVWYWNRLVFRCFFLSSSSTKKYFK